ncbi:hypothetical protein HPULCUR_006472 [Helicostylum pulchrum]|uniref:Uncharacterized protein n=1 Tax=Helicostylum pulchrum TaxID=562976 RepID=A0ABP9Y214_9FUNG
MKLLSTIAILSIPFTLADLLPGLTDRAPDSSFVKERIAPPDNTTLYEVYFARGNRIYQCNPEKEGFQHWYNVQTHAFLYGTEGQTAPFDREGNEVGQLSAAPLNPNQQMSNPMDTMPVIYNYRDGSWAGTSRPLATTTKEEGRDERGDGVHLDDHIVPVTKASTDGYLSHAKYIIRLNSLEGVVPAAETCTTKGLLINKPFTAYFMFYTDVEGMQQVLAENIEWKEMVENYTPEKLALVNTERNKEAEVAAAAEKKKAEVVAEADAIVTEADAVVEAVEKNIPVRD